MENVHVKGAKKCDILDKVLNNTEGVKNPNETHNPLPNQKSLSISQRFSKYKNESN